MERGVRQHLHHLSLVLLPPLVTQGEAWLVGAAVVADVARVA